MKKITVYDVAKEANVSLATVSRVMNGSSVVKEATRAKDLVKEKISNVLRLNIENPEIITNKNFTRIRDSHKCPGSGTGFTENYNNWSYIP